MHTYGYGEAEAVAELVERRVLISRVRREFGLSLEQAAIAVTRVSPLAPRLMARHGLTQDVAIVELIRGGG